MVQVQFQGPDGRLEGRYVASTLPNQPIALFLHPHPKHGGTMNNKVIYNTFQHFQDRGFAVLRFNFRGVGLSEGNYDEGIGELADAAAAMDWLQALNKESDECWVIGFSFGAWIGMQLLMRRPEIRGFVSVAPPANMFEFNFLAPCPTSGLIINGTSDSIVPPHYVTRLAEKLKLQKHIQVEHQMIDDANHFFDDNMDDLIQGIDNYLTYRKAGAARNFLADMGIE